MERADWIKTMIVVCKLLVFNSKQKTMKAGTKHNRLNIGIKETFVKNLSSLETVFQRKLSSHSQMERSPI